MSWTVLGKSQMVVARWKQKLFRLMTPRVSEYLLLFMIVMYGKL